VTKQRSLPPNSKPQFERPWSLAFLRWWALQEASSSPNFYSGAIDHSPFQ
jgi:hypothetical protein